MTTKERLAEAARTILLAEGADAVNMRRVAKEAGVSTMATYRHYPNR
ncbi:TetR/AcrR family transcriptional regulator [Actinophytocola sp.]|nr:TetR family transcriptional regulator [Actinophytocola sp.]